MIKCIFFHLFLHEPAKCMRYQLHISENNLILVRMKRNIREYSKIMDMLQFLNLLYEWILNLRLLNIFRYSSIIIIDLDNVSV